MAENDTEKTVLDLAVEEAQRQHVERTGSAMERRGLATSIVRQAETVAGRLMELPPDSKGCRMAAGVCLTREKYEEHAEVGYLFWPGTPVERITMRWSGGYSYEDPYSPPRVDWSEATELPIDALREVDSRLKQLLSPPTRMDEEEARLNIEESFDARSYLESQGYYVVTYEGRVPGVGTPTYSFRCRGSLSDPDTIVLRWVLVDQPGRGGPRGRFEVCIPPERTT